MLRQVCSQRRTRRGSAAVEAAVLLPLLMLLLLGVCELGWYVHCAQAVNNAARQGARTAVDCENSNAEVEGAVHSALSNSLNVSAEAVSVRMSRINSDGTEQYQVMDLSENEQGDAIRVWVSVDYGEIGFVTNMLGLDGGELSSYAVMRRRK